MATCRSELHGSHSPDAVQNYCWHLSSALWVRHLLIWQFGLSQVSVILISCSQSWLWKKIIIAQRAVLANSLMPWFAHWDEYWHQICHWGWVVTVMDKKSVRDPHAGSNPSNGSPSLLHFESTSDCGFISYKWWCSLRWGVWSPWHCSRWFHVDILPGWLN